MNEGVYLEKEFTFSAVVKRWPALEVGEGGRDGQGEEQRAEAVRRDPAAAERVEPEEGVAPLPALGVGPDLADVDENSRQLPDEEERKLIKWAAKVDLWFVGSAGDCKGPGLISRILPPFSFHDNQPI